MARLLFRSIIPSTAHFAISVSEHTITPKHRNGSRDNTDTLERLSRNGG